MRVQHACERGQCKKDCLASEGDDVEFHEASQASQAFMHIWSWGFVEILSSGNNLPKHQDLRTTRYGIAQIWKSRSGYAVGYYLNMKR